MELVSIRKGTPTEYSDDATAVKHAYNAPFVGLGDEGVTGPRRFLLSIPFHDPASGNAEEQEKHVALVEAFLARVSAE